MQVSGRAHPVTILVYLGRVFFLIIIPVVRGFVSALSGGFVGWISGAWADILVVLTMLSIAVIAWLYSVYQIDGEKIHFRYGLLLRRHKVIPLKNITVFSVKRMFFLRPLRAVKLSADTLGGGARHPDFTILLHEKKAEPIAKHIWRLDDEPPEKSYKPSTVLIVVLSLLTSGSFAGVVLIATFISQAGSILGRQFSNMMIGTFEEVSRAFAFGLPPAAAATAYILLAGWFVSAALSFIKYKNLTLTRQGQRLLVSGGMLTTRKYYVRYADINFIDMRQSIVTRLLKLKNLYLSATGYGKQKDDISYIIPSGREPSFSLTCENLFPKLIPVPRSYPPGATGIMRFLGQPIFSILCIAAALVIFPMLFPSWKSFILFTGLMAFIPALFFLFTRIADYSTGGLGFSGENYVLRYSIGFTLHTAIIPADKVVSVELRQSFFQKFGRYCDLVIRTKSEGRAVHRCRSMIKADMQRFFAM